MTVFDWIELLLPVFLNLAIAGFLAVYFKAYLEKKFKDSEKSNQYMMLTMSNLYNLILKLEHHILDLATGVIEVEPESIRQLFVIGGEIQVYVDDYRTYFEQVNKKFKRDVYELETLDELIKELLCCGKLLQKGKTDSQANYEFGKRTSQLSTVCNKIIQSYNTTMSGI